MKTRLSQYLQWILNRINRGSIALVIGALSLWSGVKAPWYQLPPDVLEPFGINLAVVNSGRAIAALSLATVLISVCFFKGISRPRLLFWIGSIAVLLFPYLVTTWMPEVDFVATSYYEQGDAVMQHIHANFPLVQSQWKQNVRLYNPRPIESTFDFSIADGRFFQIASWDQFLVEGLGYSNGFLEFIGRGWVSTLIGLGICLFAFYLELNQGRISAVIKDIKTLLPCLAFLLVALGFSLVVPSIINHQLDTYLAKGDYDRVVVTSKTIAAWYPPLKGDLPFLKRIAIGGLYSDKPDAALIAFFNGYERFLVDDFQTAAMYFRQSLAIQPNSFLVRGYLARTLMCEGIDYFNDADSKQTTAAVEAFEEVLQIFPGHLEALYDLMLARTVNGQFTQSAAIARMIIDSQIYHQHPDLAVLGQAYLHLSWSSYHKGDTAKAWEYYRNSVDESSWGEASEMEQVSSQTDSGEAGP
jgi:tetratricopeptide (TPR) repeat protein